MKIYEDNSTTSTCTENENLSCSVIPRGTNKLMHIIERSLL